MSEPIVNRDPSRSGITSNQAGWLAALVMVSAQLVWRLAGEAGGVVQAFPEFVLAAIARLTPLSVFGAATENYGGSAKKMLFILVVLGIVAIGGWGGVLAGRIAKTRAGLGGRLLGGMATAAIFLLVAFVVILPIAHLGFFATDSSYTRDIVTQLVVTFALFGLLLALLLPLPAVALASGGTVSRRDAISQGAWGIASLAGLASVVGLTWRLLSPRSTGDPVVQRQTATDIVATQRARQGNPLATETPIAAADTLDVAAVQSDVTPPPADDPFGPFIALEEQGKLPPVLTPTKDFYHVSKNLQDPTVDAKDWKLELIGLFDREISFSYEEMLERSTTFNITTLCCISNRLNGDLISTAEWSGVPLVDLLTEAGLKDSVVDLIFQAADDYEDSIPVAVALDPNVLVVTGMNGEPLPDDHGFPVRMIIPPIYGMKNVKWVTGIQAVDFDFKGYWQTRGWSDPAPYQIWGRFDSPRESEKIEAGPFTVSGVASAGNRDIARVEISLDDGETWADAILEPSLNPPFTWVRWRFDIEAKPGELRMLLRATDGTGVVMDKTERDTLPDGPTGWPQRICKVKD